jgi:CheY-like chemotaxis protein
MLKRAIKISNLKNIHHYASNGKNALEMVMKNLESNENKFYDCHLILVDCNMPIMDGYNSTYKIRQFLFNQGLNQPVIAAVTRHVEKEYVKSVMNCGIELSSV